MPSAYPISAQDGKTVTQDGKTTAQDDGTRRQDGKTTVARIKVRLEFFWDFLCLSTHSLLFFRRHNVSLQQYKKNIYDDIYFKWDTDFPRTYTVLFN